MIKKIQHPLFTNFVSLLFLQGVNYVLPLITVPYLFRVLSVEKYGLINFASSFIQYFIVFTDFGYNLSATRLIAGAKENITEQSIIFCRVMASKMLLLCISLIVLLILIFSVDRFAENKGLYLFTFGMVAGNVLFPVWFFLGTEKMKFITLITVITRVLSLIPIFALVKSTGDYLLVPVINSGGTILSGLISLAIIKKVFGIKFYVPGAGEIIHSLKDSARFFASRVSVSMYTVSNSFVLGMFGSNTIVGYYSAAEKLFIALQSAYVPVNNTLYPYMTKNKNVALYKKIFIWTTVINVVGVAMSLLTTADVVNIIYGIRDMQSVLTLKLLLVACLVIVPSILLGYPFLGAMGYTKYTNNSVIVSSVFHIAMLTILVITNQLSVYTVAATVIATETIVLSIRAWGVYKYGLFKISS